MRHQKVKQWEKKLKHIFDEIDTELETQYAGRFSRHPARPKHGTTSNPEMDGLFNVGASYSAGFGSKWGPGYVVDIRLATLQPISRHFKNELRNSVQQLLKQKLPIAFPNKKLCVSKDKNYLRIHGDLSLD